MTAPARDVSPTLIRAHRPTLGDFTADGRTLRLALMAVVAGLGGVAGAWVLLRLINLMGNLIWFDRFSVAQVSLAHAHRGVWMVVAPVLGGLAVGLMARYGSDKIRGHGIPEAIEAILIGQSRMSAKVAVLKPLSSAISIGSGGPFGAEGPIIMTGGALGSLFGQCFSLTAAERKTLLVAGASAGMTAIFGTPVAAALLALELLLFEWKPRSLIPVGVSVLTAIALRPSLFGVGPMFFAPAAPPLSAALVGEAIVVGLVAGLQSGFLTKLLYIAEDLFEALPVHWMWRPALGGLAVGLGGLVDPRALGVGYDLIGDMLAGHVPPASAALALGVKAVIWIVALASGTSGGVLAPLLILGGALGVIEAHWLPGPAGFWALTAMAAMMGGTMRAPLTGAVFALELTGRGEALLPLLAASLSAYTVTVLLMRRSILTEKIARRGLHLTREYSVDPFEVTRVAAIMASPVDTLPASMPVDEAVAFFSAEAPRHKSYPVIEVDGRLVGMASRADVLRWRREGGHGGATLAELASGVSLLAVHPDDLVADVADAMVQAGVGRAPVLDPANNRVIGLIARKDLLHIRQVEREAEETRSRG